MSGISYVTLSVSFVLAVAWLPIARFFWRSWRVRGAPLSLAICALVGYPVATNIGACVFLRNDPEWTIFTLALLNALVLGNFYWRLWEQRKTFPDARKPTDKPTSEPKIWPNWRSKG